MVPPFVGTACVFKICHRYNYISDNNSEISLCYSFADDTVSKRLNMIKM